MSGVSALALAVTAAALIATTPAWARGAVSIHEYSQAVSEESANAGASITYAGHAPGQAPSPAAYRTPASPAAAGTAPEPPAEPTISTNSPLYRSPHPAGPQTFWYPPEGTQRCMYVPASNGACFNVVAPAKGQPAGPQIDPAALAAEIAAGMSLNAGEVVASPSARVAGLTGAASWFWLSPPPAGRSVSLSLGGETVTVSASPSSVQWSFGDGSATSAGPGVPYRPGPAPAGAVRHVYDTRCLPGDEGHDPYVLASCGPQGYRVEASAIWSISFVASGPVSAGGALPSRTTATSIPYPVSEARAFLTGAGGSR